MKKIPPGSGSVKRLRFGQYKGQPISAVPADYLEFLIKTAEETISDCREELTRREAAAEASLPWVQRVVEAGFRALAKQHHPDHGGTNDAMSELIAAVECLRERVREG
jgi:hypothetical protein